MKKIPIRHMAPEQLRTPAVKIRSLQDVTNGAALVQDLHRHEFYFILAVEKGVGHHEIDFVPFQVQDHTIFCMRPGQVHRLELQPGCSGFLLEFQPDFYHPSDTLSAHRLYKASSKNFCRLEKGRFEKLQAILSLLYHEALNREEGYLDAIRAGLDYFFIEFIRQSPDPKRRPAAASGYQQHRFEELMQLLQIHIAEHKEVTYYTAAMNLSAYQLNAITRTAVGKTLSKLINEQILLEARRYLLATATQVKEITDLLGFEDPSYFIRFFRKHMGQSPEAFRAHFTKVL